MFFYRHFFIVLLVVILSSCSGTTDCKYDVKETKVTREEFLEACQHTSDYVYAEDNTNVSPVEKKRVQEAVLSILTDKEKEMYAKGDLEILNIRRYSNGEYVVCLLFNDWQSKAVLLNEKLEPYLTVMEGGDFTVYTTSGIFAGCEGFDCDFHALIHFYAHNGEEPGRLEKIAFYKNTKWMLEWLESFPEYKGIENRMVWYKDALYCAGLEFLRDENKDWYARPYFVKLELVKKG